MTKKIDLTKEKPKKTSGLWIKNTDGKPDAVLTMTLMGFLVIMAKIALSGVVLKLAAGVVYDFGTIDGMVVAAVLTSTLGAYVARKYTDTKNVKED